MENTIQGPRIRLEPLNQSHVPALWRALNSPEIWNHRHNSRVPRSEKDLEEFVKKAILRQLPYIIIDHENIIGTISLKITNHHNRVGEICYILIGQKYSGKKYASEAIYLLIEYCFKILQYHRVEIEVLQDSAAEKLVTSLGLKCEGIKREARRIEEDKYTNLKLFSLLVSEYDSERMLDKVITNISS
ncbi:Protein N-acetyltransferase, RimJ/RimL family [Seinonella peptonophila]|uniref:Protein N-acetyltransferase, RimJ/RimL family n=1 Tax=Seinonella peptonophila TaxID=112248 RepID=A0A1M4SN82_9BACL|nr:Protein N-acetyltransferase, RimJ/RimL family [Seinonella peptonophila]